jgi:putative NADH-flavin reductase
VRTKLTSALAKDVIKAACSLIKGLTHAGVPRLVVVGGAGSLEIAAGLRLVDTPDFPEIYRPASLAHCETLDIYKSCDLDWTFISPAAFFDLGKRTGKYRIGTDRLLVDSVLCYAVVQGTHRSKHRLPCCSVTSAPKR